MAGFSVDQYFKLQERNTDLKTEIRAGVTTFLMMAYIIVVNPGILSNGGMPFSGVLFATVLVGVFMAQPLKKIDWKFLEDAVPAFQSVVLIPLTFSITQGVIWSFSPIPSSN